MADIAGPGAIVQDGCGVKVPVESPGQFIRDYGRAVTGLLQDAPARQEMGRNARRIIVEHYRWEIVERTVLEAYEEIGRRLLRG